MGRANNNALTLYYIKLPRCISTDKDRNGSPYVRGAGATATPFHGSAVLAPEPAEGLKIKWGRQIVMWWAKSASNGWNRVNYNLQKSGGANALPAFISAGPAQSPVQYRQRPALNILIDSISISEKHVIGIQRWIFDKATSFYIIWRREQAVRTREGATRNKASDV
jgi:hypothetical protein